MSDAGRPYPADLSDAEWALLATSEAMIYGAMNRLVLRRLPRGAAQPIS